MPTEATLENNSFLAKCYIHWKTKNYGKKIEHISLMLCVAIYMNKKIYEEELKSASIYLESIFEDKNDIENIMDYVKMKLQDYQKDEQSWIEDKKDAFDLIVKDEELYSCMSDIFNADDSFDENEELFEKALKRIL